MDALHILILMARAAHGDEEASEELSKASAASIVNAIKGIETLTGVSIDPGSFIMGMAFEAHDGLNGFADPELVKHMVKHVELVRDVYASQEADES